MVHFFIKRFLFFFPIFLFFTSQIVQANPLGLRRALHSLSSLPRSLKYQLIHSSLKPLSSSFSNPSRPFISPSFEQTAGIMEYLYPSFEGKVIEKAPQGSFWSEAFPGGTILLQRIEKELARMSDSPEKSDLLNQVQFFYREGLSFDYFFNFLTDFLLFIENYYWIEWKSIYPGLKRTDELDLKDWRIYFSNFSRISAESIPSFFFDLLSIQDLNSFAGSKNYPLSIFFRPQQADGRLLTPFQCLLHDFTHAGPSLRKFYGKPSYQIQQDFQKRRIINQAVHDFISNLEKAQKPRLAEAFRLYYWMLWHERAYDLFHLKFAIEEDKKTKSILNELWNRLSKGEILFEPSFSFIGLDNSKIYPADQVLKRELYIARALLLKILSDGLEQRVDPFFDE